MSEIPTVPARDAREVARMDLAFALVEDYARNIGRSRGKHEHILVAAIEMALRDARREALLWAADKIEVEPAVNAIPFAEMLRALASADPAPRAEGDRT